MTMTSFPLTFAKVEKKVTVQFDRNRFERLAGSLGLFSDDFLNSIARAKKDIRQGRVKKLRSLRDLRSR